MKYRFQDFEFDAQQRVLTRSGEVYSLNEKAALLLSLLLDDVKKIHSKADILDFVWADRVVTDQVVFQNISTLRAIFGDAAIKTFSRKGYQWQLPLEVCDQAEGDKTQTQALQQFPKGKINKIKVLQVLGLALVVFAVVFFGCGGKQVVALLQLTMVKHLRLARSRFSGLLATINR